MNIKKILLLLVICAPAMLSAQNGITVSGPAIEAGTVTFDVSWKDTGMPEIWSDTVWVFVDYNSAGNMARLPLITGATLTNTSAPGVAEVIEVPGNDKGVWLVGNARSVRSFSATVKLLTSQPSAVGACAYAVNYLPVGVYTSTTDISFRGTQPYDLTLNDAGGSSSVTQVPGSSFTIPGGYTLASFTDKTGAPGKIECIPMSGNIDFVVMPETVVAGQPATFTVSVEPTVPASAVTYIWSAPSFTPATHTGATFTPAAPTMPGDYEVTLTARSTAYCDLTETKSVTTISCFTPNIYNFNVSALTFCSGSSVTFSLLNTDPGSTYLLYKGDEPVLTLTGTGSPETFTGAFTGAGTYTVRVEAKTESGTCGANMTGSYIIVENPLPDAPAGVGNARCGAGTVTISATSSGAEIDWYASDGSPLLTGSNSYTTPTINSSTTYYAAARNATTGCTSATRTAVPATVNPLPDVPTGVGNARCGAGTVTISATSSGAEIDWYVAPSGGSSVHTGNSYTLSITGSTTYYAEARIAATGCRSARTPVLVTANTVPDAPTMSGGGTYCGAATLTAMPGANGDGIWWERDAISSSTITVTSSGTYYAISTSSSDCVSDAASVEVIINPVPAAPVMGNTGSNCGMAVITATPGSGGNGIRWTDNGSTVSPRREPSSVTLNSTYTAVTTSAEGCTSGTASVSVTITGAPPFVAPPVMGGGGTYCEDESSSVTAMPGNGGSGILWLDDGSTNSYRYMHTSGTYTAVTTSGGCVSAPASVVRAVVPRPAPPVMGNAGLTCGMAIITATPSTEGAGIQWADNSSTVSPRYIVPSSTFTESGTYYARTTIGNCMSSPAPVTVTVNYSSYPAPPVMTGGGTYCEDQSSSVTATPGTGGNGILWLDDGSTYSYRYVNTGGTYTAVTTNGSCASPPASVVRAVVPQPAAPAVSGSGTYCEAATLTATPGSGGDGIWWQQPISSSSSSVTVTASGTYYARTTIGHCTSGTASVEVIISRPDSPTGVNNARTGAGTVTISASLSGAEIDWYVAASGGSSVHTGNSYTVTITESTTYYAEARNTTTNCVSALRTPVLAAVNPLPANPVGVGNARCGNGTVTISATTTSSGAEIDWYVAASGGSSVHTGNSYTPSITGSTTYYAEARNTSTGEVSASRTPVLATMNPRPALPTGVNNARCGAGTVTISATSSGAVIDWYVAATGGSSVHTGNSYTPSITGSTTYYAEARNTTTGCLSASRRPVLAAVNNVPAAPPTSAGGTYCGATTITASPGSGGTGIRWDDGSTTSPRTVTTSGTYYAVTTAGSCTSSTATVAVTINPVPAEPVLSGGGVQCGTATLTATPGANGNGIRWDDGTTYTTRVVNASGIYYAVTTSPAGCTSGTVYEPVTIHAVPAEPIMGGNGLVCGTEAVITASPGSGGTGIRWDDGSTTSPRTVTTSGTYYAITTSTAGNCTSSTATVIVTISPRPDAPTGASAESRCGSGTLTFSATAPGGVTIDWYVASSGGSSVHTGNSYTPSITESTTYYAEARVTATGCTSASRTPVSGTVIPKTTAGQITGACGCVDGLIDCDGTCTNPMVGNIDFAVTPTPVLTGQSATFTLSSRPTTPAASAITYSWSAPDFTPAAHTGATFTPVAPATVGNYNVTLTARSTGYCDLTLTKSITVTPAVNPPPANPTGVGNARCGAGTVTISATTTSSGAEIDWYVAATGGSSVHTGNSYTPSITGSTIYYAEARITATGAVSALRTPVVATMNLLPALHTGVGNARCGAGTVTISATSIGSEIDWYVAATGGSSVHTGNSYTPSITESTTYYAEARATTTGCRSARMPVLATMNTVPDDPAQPSADERCGAGEVTFHAVVHPSCTINWYDAPDGAIVPGDFGRDWFTTTISQTTTLYARAYNPSTGCSSAGYLAVTATVSSAPAKPTVTGSGTYCGTAYIGATSDCENCIMRWSSNHPSGDTQPGISVGVSTSGTYDVVAISTDNGCTSSTATVVVTILPVPAPPTITYSGTLAGPDDEWYCGAATITVTPGNGGNGIRWTDNGSTASSRTVAVTGSEYEDITSGESFGYSVVTTSAAGCKSSEAYAGVGVYGLPQMPSVSGSGTYCGQSKVSISASPVDNGYQYGFSIRWDDGPTSSNREVSASGTYYARTVSQRGCAGPAGTVPVTLLSAPPSSPTGVGNARCGAGTVTISASSSGAVIDWYANASGGTPLVSGSNSYTTPTISNSTTYYAQARHPASTSTSCMSASRTPVLARVLTDCGFYGCDDVIVSTTSVSDNLRTDWNSAYAYCSNLEGGGWRLPEYDEMECICRNVTGLPYSYWMGGEAGSEYYDVWEMFACVSSQAYYNDEMYVICVQSGVTSGGGSTTPPTTPAKPTVSGAGTYCGAATITATPGANGTGIRWTDSGSTVSSRTVTASGTYYAVTTSAAGTSTSSSVVVVINSVPAAPTISQSTTACGTTLILAKLGSGGTGFRWLDNSSTVSARIVEGGNYYAVTTSAAGCESTPGTVVVPYKSYLPLTTLGLPTVCCGGTYCGAATLTATPGTGGNGIWWADDATAATVTSRVVTTSGTYAAVTTSATCSSAPVSVVVVINSGQSVANPTGVSNSRCGAGTVTISASSSGAVIDWYASASGGTPLVSGSNSYTTPTISNSTTYYAQARSTSSTSCVSASRTPVLARVNSVPAAPTLSGGGSTCGMACFQATPGAGGTGIRWSHATGDMSGTFTSSAASVCVPNPTNRTVFYTMYAVTTSAAGCESAPASRAATVTYNSSVAPPVMSSSGTHCGAATITATPGYNSIGVFWLDNFSSATSRAVTASGTYVAVSIAATCASSPASVVVSITSPSQNASLAKPTMSGGGTYCNSATLTATPGAGGTGIRWTDSGSTVSSRTVTTNGTYTAVTTAGNCTSGTATASVAVTFVPNCVAQTNSCSGFTMISSTSNTGRSWNATSAYCSSLEGGWRVPSLSGLQCICENKSAIPGLLSTGYWSNYGLTLVYAAALDMATCAPGEAQMSAELRVLCVR